MHDRVSKLLSPSLLVVQILATRYGLEQRQLDARHNGDLIPDVPMWFKGTQCRHMTTLFRACSVLALPK